MSDWNGEGLSYLFSVNDKIIFMKEPISEFVEEGEFMMLVFLKHPLRRSWRIWATVLNDEDTSEVIVSIAFEYMSITPRIAYVKVFKTYELSVFDFNLYLGCSVFLNTVRYQPSKYKAGSAFCSYEISSWTATLSGAHLCRLSRAKLNGNNYIMTRELNYFNLIKCNMNRSFGL